MHLTKQGHEVIAVDNYLKRDIEKEVGGEALIEMPKMDARAQRFAEEGGAEIKTAVVDVRDFDALRKLLSEHKPDAIVHYAEQPSGPYSMRGWNEASLTLHNNVGGTLNLVHAMLAECPDAHLVKLGTMGEYGTPGVEIPEGWFDLEFRGRTCRTLFPRQAGSFYHTTKILDTDLLWFYVRMKGLRVTDLMQGPVYGVLSDKSYHPELGTHFHYDDIFGTCLNRFVVQAVIGMPLPVYGQGGQTRGYLDIRDTVQCINLAILNPADKGELKVMNQFTEDFSANSLAERVQSAGAKFDLEVKIDHIDNPRIELEDHFYKADFQHLPDLGLEPHYLTEDTILEMMDYVKRHEDKVDRSKIMPRVKWR
jgi:UDP-sulfoquinovose synthase